MTVNEIPHVSVIGLAYPLLFDDVARQLAASAEIRVASSADDASIGNLVRDVDALIIRGPARLTRAMIEQSPRLRVVAVTGSGTNHVDVAAATDNGIPIVSGKGVAPDAVAEYVIGGLIAARRRLLQLHHDFVTGELDWDKRLRDAATHEVTGSTLGIVGIGFIGRAVARIATRGLGMRVLAFDRHIEGVEPGLEVTILDDLHEMLVASDAVSVHAPFTDETRGMIGREELRLIGPEGVLINASRGGVVDEDAVVAALRAGELGGAVIDVFASEPPSSETLAQFRQTPNLIITPHIAGVTVESRHRLERNAVEQVLRVLRGQPPTAVVNPEVALPRFPTRAG